MVVNPTNRGSLMALLYCSAVKRLHLMRKFPEAYARVLEVRES